MHPSSLFDITRHEQVEREHRAANERLRVRQLAARREHRRATLKGVVRAWFAGHPGSRAPTCCPA
jgi:hypothetical protein